MIKHNNPEYVVASNQESIKRLVRAITLSGGSVFIDISLLQPSALTAKNTETIDKTSLSPNPRDNSPSIGQDTFHNDRKHQWKVHNL